MSCQLSAMSDSRLLLFFFEAGEFVGDDFGFGEFGARGQLGAAAGGAEGFENAAGVDAATHGHAAGAGDLEQGVAGLAQDLDEAFDLAGGGGHLQHDGFGGEVDDPGAEYVGELEDVGAGVEAVGFIGAGGDLDEAELADDAFAAADLVDVDGDFEFVERGADAVGGSIGGLADDGHARGVGALRLAYGERNDVDVETAEE